MVDVPAVPVLNSIHESAGGVEEPAKEPPTQSDDAAEAVFVAPQKVKEWTVQVHRSCSAVRWGLTVDVFYQHGLVTGVTEYGAVAMFNALAPNGEEIRPGDLISSVCHCTDAVAMEEVLKSDVCDLDLALARPKVHQVTVKLKEGVYFGAGLGRGKKGIQVQSIMPKGLLATHNKAAEPDESILLGDIICGMSPRQSTTRDIVAILERVGEDADFSCGELTLDILRPPRKDV